MDLFFDERELEKPVKLGSFYSYFVFLGIVGLIVTATFGTLVGLNLWWTTHNTFVSASSDVFLYPSSSCSNGSYVIVVGTNQTCISTSSTPVVDNDTLYDNTTVILSTSNPSRSLGFSIGGSTNTQTILQTSQTVNRTATLPDFDGTLLVQQTGTGFVFIGQTAQDHGSNAGIQQSSLTANRAQIRLNQYGANTAGAGTTRFKSRSTTIGASQSVLAGDVLSRDTTVAVSGDDSTIPLAATISINAAFVASNYVGTEYELALVDADGIVNGRRPVFKINSHGWPQFLESGSTNPQPAPTTPPSDVVVLGVGGTIVVVNRNIPSNARIQLTVQPGQTPLGVFWVSAIVAGTSFTISSTNVADAGVSIYYMIFVPL